MHLPFGRTGDSRSVRVGGAGAAPILPSRIDVDRLSLREILSAPLPEAGWTNRFLLRAIMVVARRQVGVIDGLEHIHPAHDPFILAFNHNTRRETILVPGALIFHRSGRLVHIWADWVYRMIPGVGLILRQGGTIVVTSKPARLTYLNRFRWFYEKPLPALERARAHLHAGRSVGVFPEGRISRDPRRLRPGRPGMARLSLETGVPIVPVGIRYPGVDPDRPIAENAAMEVHIGAPLRPPTVGAGKPSPATVRAWHATVMTEIARLAGKTWHPRATGGERR